MKWLVRYFYGKWLSVARLQCAFLFCGYLLLSGTAIADVLTVTMAGTGSGSVNSVPAGIACVSGNSANCSASFTSLSGITLTATPDWKSLEGVFSVGCSGTGSCSFNISGDTGVTATFNPDYQAALGITHPVNQPEFSSLNDAYTYAYTNGVNNFNLNARVNIFVENLILNHQINFTLAGGKNPGYLSNGGFTTLAGYLEVQNGSVEIDSLIIQ